MNRGRRGAIYRHHEGGVLEPPAEQEFGQKTVGPNKGVLAAERERVWRFTMPEAGELTKLVIYLEPGSASGEQKLKGIVYEDTSGKPKSLLGSTNEKIYKSEEIAGYYNLTFATRPKLEAGPVWIGVMNGNGTSGATGYRFETVSNARNFMERTYAEGPAATFGTPGVDSELITIYATYIPGVQPAEVPTNITVPIVSGEAKVGAVLTATQGTWKGGPTERKNEWLRCDASGASCVIEATEPPPPLSGVRYTGTTYTLRTVDQGHTIRAQEIAKNAIGESEPAVSAATAVVTSSSSAIALEPMIGLNQDSPALGGVNNTAASKGAKGCRYEFGIGGGTNKLVEVCNEANAKSILLQPLAGFQSRIPTSAEAKGLASWCQALEGKQWKKRIEFGNETNYPNQLHNRKGLGEQYAVRVKEAAEACAPFGVEILAQASDNGAGGDWTEGQAAWINGMFNAVPNLASYVGGWTIHAYASFGQPLGNNDTFGVPMMERMVKNLEEHNELVKPIDNTEWGPPSTASGQFHTYTEAKEEVDKALPKLKTASKNRLRTFTIYQAHDQAAAGASSNSEQYQGVLTNTGARKDPYTSRIESLWVSGA